MNHPKYDVIYKSEDDYIYDFVSRGKKGDIAKRIQFSETEFPLVYNLGFGDKTDHGIFDDTVNSNNGDRDKILSTVVSAVYDFTDTYPERFVIFFGTNAVRTRLYRMAISLYLDELNKDFHIFAIKLSEDELLTIPFEKDILCDGFLVKKIKNNQL